MKKELICGWVLIFLLLAWFPASRSWSDGGYFSSSRSIAVSTDQREIIIKNGEQISMTLSTGYAGEGEDFCWIIPTPVAPAVHDVREAGDAGEAAFELLQQHTAPVVTAVSQGEKLGGMAQGTGPSAGPVSPVTVYGMVTLEHYEISILGAEAGGPLLAWLKRNGYAVAPSAQRVLDAYARERWAFVAVKLNPSEKRHYEEEFLPPLTIRYSSSRLVYPLRISAVSTTQTVGITLYVITQSTVTASNLPVKTLVFEDLIPRSENAAKYVEDCIRETSGSDGRTLAVLWKGKIESADELDQALNGLTKNPFPAGAAVYLTRLETLMAPSALSRDVDLRLEQEPRQFRVGLSTPLTGVWGTPWKVAGVYGARKISGLHLHTSVLKEDGTVWSWGNPRTLGDGSTGERSTPVQVRSLSGVAAIAAGTCHTAALKSDGSVWTWGGDKGGSLIYRKDPPCSKPVQVRGLSGVVAIAAGGGHTVALKGDATVWTWGINSRGQLGDGSNTERLKPVQVKSLSGIVAIAAGGYHTVALKEDGTVWAWGHNCSGQLGDGTATDRLMPVQVKSLTGVVAVEAGYAHTVALKGDATVWTWGVVGGRQLSDGTTTDRSTPARVEGFSGGVAAVAAGYRSSAALTSDGTVWTWGAAGSTPARVKGLSGVVAMAAGSSHSVALKDDGTVWASSETAAPWTIPRSCRSVGLRESPI